MRSTLQPQRLWAIAVAAGVALAAPSAASAHAEADELRREADVVVRQRPADPQAHLGRARVLQLSGEWDAALTALESAARYGADPDDVGATRAAVLLDAGRPQQALDEIDRVLVRRPDAARLVFERGRIRLALGQTERAAEDFGVAIAAMRQPRPEHVFTRRDALLSLGRREAAVAALDVGMLRVGRVASLQLAAMDLEVELERYDDALRRVDELLASSGRNPVWIARRGEILYRAGRRDEGRAEYRRALAVIEAGSERQRIRAFDELKRRLESVLASTS